MKKKVVRLTESDLIRIVKKVIKEQSEASSELSTVNNILSQANLGPISQEDVPELVSDCPVYAPNQKLQGYLDRIKEIAENADINTLKSELKRVISASKKIEEQAVTTFFVIFGLSIPLIEFAIIFAAIALIIVSVISKRIMGEKEKSKGKAYCEKSNSKILSKLGIA